MFPVSLGKYMLEGWRKGEPSPSNFGNKGCWYVLVPDKVHGTKLEVRDSDLFALGQSLVPFR